jgi:hypothetical protein
LHDFVLRIFFLVLSGNWPLSTRVILQHIWAALLSGFLRRTPKQWPGALQKERSRRIKTCGRMSPSCRGVATGYQVAIGGEL